MIARWLRQLRSKPDSRAELERATERCHRDARTLRARVRTWDRQEKRLRRRLERAHREDRALEVQAVWQELSRHKEDGERLSRHVRDSSLEREVLGRAMEALDSVATGPKRSTRHWWNQCERAGLFEREGLERERRESQRERLMDLLTELGGDPQRLRDRDEELLGVLSELERGQDRVATANSAVTASAASIPLKAMDGGTR